MVFTSDDTGSDFSPCSAIFQNKLYVVWQTNDPSISDGTDDDLVIRSFDGEVWGLVTEITLESDEYPDHDPQMIVHDKHLHVTWQGWDEKNSTEIIMCRSFNGETWSSIERPSQDLTENWSPRIASAGGILWLIWATYDPDISPSEDSEIVAKKMSEGTWSQHLVMLTNNTGEDDLPEVCTFNGKLYVAWRTNDAGLSSGEDWDIVMRWCDEAVWNEEVFELTPGDVGDDFWPRMSSSTERLVIAWQTTDSGISSGTDTDVVARWLDEERWGPIVEISPGDDERNDGGELLRDPVAICSFDGAFWVVWETNTSLSLSSDYDSWIMGRSISFTEETREEQNHLLIVMVGLLASALVAWVLWSSRSRSSRG